MRHNHSTSYDYRLDPPDGLYARQLERAADNLAGASDLIASRAKPLLYNETASLTFSEPEIDEDSWAEPGTEGIISEGVVKFWVDADCSPAHIIEDAIKTLRAIADRLEQTKRNPLAKGVA